MGVGCNFIVDHRLKLVGTNQPMIKDNQLHAHASENIVLSVRGCLSRTQLDKIYEYKCPTNICMSITIININY